MSNSFSSGNKGWANQKASQGGGTEESRRVHERSDVDQGVLALHHTLGPGPAQAAPGNHDHPKFVEKNTLTFNVLDYGENVGSGGDDTAAFAAALTAAATHSTVDGAEVFVPAGVYNITNLSVADKVSIRGAGSRASRIQCTAVGTSFSIGKDSVLQGLYIVSTIGTNVGIKSRANSLHTTIRDCSVNGHQTGIYLDNSFIIQIENCSIQSNGTGLRCGGTVGCNIVTVRGGEIQGSTVQGVLIDGANNYALKFLGTTVEGGLVGFQVNGATYNLTIRDCYMEANPNGHVMFGGSGHFGPVIDANFFTGSGNYGVYAGPGLAVRDVKVTHNTFNITTAAARNLYLGSGVLNAEVISNHTISGAAGVPFDPSVDFLGTRLIHIDNSKLSLRASAATVSAGGAPLNIPHGTAPTSPVNGDIWTTTAGLYVRINGVTVGPLS